MKVSIKEIKVEEDGSEILYMRDVGFILKSETFSGPLKRCLEKGNEGKEKEKGNEKDIDLEAFIPSLTQIISQITTQPSQHQAGAEASGGEAPQDKSKESVEEKKKPE